MPILPIILVTAACLPLPWPAPPGGLSAGGAVVLSLLVTAVPVLIAVGLSQWVAVTLAGDPGRRPDVFRTYLRGRRWLSFAQLAFSGLVLAGCGWGWTVWHALLVPHGETELLPPGAEALVPLPYVLMLLGCWAAFHRADAALHRTSRAAARRFWSVPGYVFYHARQLALLVLFPAAVFAAHQGLSRWFPVTVRGVVYQLAAVAGGVLVVVGLPWLARPLLGLKRLPPGPVRDRLEATARRLDCRLADLLVWPTPGAAAHAQTMGVTPWARYVVFTDRLLDNLTPDELDAVFGHEAGHVHRSDTAYYAAFFVLSGAVGMAVVLAGEQLAAHWGWEPSAAGRPGWQTVPPVLLAFGYVFGAFGLVSRRCERQADVSGARAGSCGDAWCTTHTADTVLPPGGKHLCRCGTLALARAVDRVAALNGGEAGVPAGLWARAWGRLRAWQHGPLGDRAVFLRKLADDPHLGDRTDREATQFRRAVLGALAAALLTLGTAVGWGDLWARM